MTKELIITKIIFLCEFYNFQFKQTAHRLFVEFGTKYQTEVLVRKITN